MTDISSAAITLLVLSTMLVTSAAISDADLKRARAALPDITFGDFGYGSGNYSQKNFRNWMEKHLEPDDIVISSYPKSGTNWVKQIVHLIRLRADVVKLDQYADKDLSVLINIPSVIPNFDFEAVSEIRPRAFFDHLQWPDVAKGARYIYIMRDMLDVVASFFNYVGKFGDNFANHDVNDAARLLMDGLLYCGTWESHVASFWEQRNNPNVLLLKFEDLKEDHAGQVARIAKFLKYDLSKEELNRIVEMSSFEYMKASNSKIQGKEWAEKTTGQKIKDDYKLLNDGTSGKGGFRPEVMEAMRKHFRDKAAPLLGNPASYKEFKVQGGHDEL